MSKILRQRRLHALNQYAAWLDKARHARAMSLNPTHLHADWWRWNMRQCAREAIFWRHVIVTGVGMLSGTFVGARWEFESEPEYRQVAA